MIIDFHTHTFPDELADRAVGTLAHSGGIHNYLDGRVHSLTDSMKKAGIDYSVLLPVATKPNQCDTINTLALKTNETSETTDRKSTRLNSSHKTESRMPSSA